MHLASIALWVSTGIVLTAAGLTLIVTGATARLHDRTTEEIDVMMREAAGDVSVVQSFELDRLPSPVRRWLMRAGVVGRPRAQTVHLHQEGQMHASPDGAWFAISAEQSFRADEPEFVWWMQGRMSKVLPIAGRDKLAQGEGEMHMTAGGLVDVAFARGPKIDQGALLRYLAEIIWFPSAALRSYIVWEPIDETSAKATISFHGVTASATFQFDAAGRAIGLEARRYYGADGELEPWGGRMTAWSRVRGIEIPTRGEVVWHLAAGDFTFFRWEITDVETNPASAGDSSSGSSSGGVS